MAEIIHATFGEPAICRLMDDLRETIKKPVYDDVTLCEIIGVLEMLKAEYFETIFRG